MRPEAGWYPDPSDNQQLRWWDGARWTEERTSAAGAVSAKAVEDHPVVSTSEVAAEPTVEPTTGPDEPVSLGKGADLPPEPATPAHQTPNVPPALSRQQARDDWGYRGVAMSESGLRLADVGTRLLARVIDWVFLWMVQSLALSPWRDPYIAVYERHMGNFPNPGSDPFALLNEPAYTRFLAASVVIGLLVGLLYEVLLLRYQGATLGKLACRIKVVNRSGGGLSWGQALGRWAAVYPLADLTCYLWRLIDGVWCLFDPERDCLHDKMAHTQVISTRG